MLEIARAKFRPGEQIGFQPADAVALPFADASFDAVVCQFGVMFFPDKARSFSLSHSRPRRPLCVPGRMPLQAIEFLRNQEMMTGFT
jgi:hypothetical protein